MDVGVISWRVSNLPLVGNKLGGPWLCLAVAAQTVTRFYHQERPHANIKLVITQLQTCCNVVTRHKVPFLQTYQAGWCCLAFTQPVKSETMNCCSYFNYNPLDFNLKYRILSWWELKLKSSKQKHKHLHTWKSNYNGNRGKSLTVCQCVSGPVPWDTREALGVSQMSTSTDASTLDLCANVPTEKSMKDASMADSSSLTGAHAPSRVTAPPPAVLASPPHWWGGVFDGFSVHG